MARIKVNVSDKIHFVPKKKKHKQNKFTVNLAGAPGTWI